VQVPLWLVFNPEEGSGGGGASGGLLVVEVQQQPDPLRVVIHESLHFLVDPRRADVEAAAVSARLTWEQLNEGIAYALAPGLIDDPADSRDSLVDSWLTRSLRGANAADTFVKFYMVAVVIRPLLRSALDGSDTLTTFLPKAAEKWRTVTKP